MGADGVSGGMNLPDHVRIGLRHPADEEEGCLDAFGSEDVENAAS